MMLKKHTCPESSAGIDLSIVEPVARASGVGVGEDGADGAGAAGVELDELAVAAEHEATVRRRGERHRQRDGAARCHRPVGHLSGRGVQPVQRRRADVDEVDERRRPVRPLAVHHRRRHRLHHHRATPGGRQPTGPPTVKVQHVKVILFCMHVVSFQTNLK
jgi:hypothetical protein